MSGQHRSAPYALYMPFCFAIEVTMFGWYRTALYFEEMLVARIPYSINNQLHI
ncbi:MAG TPA: hypothetical protein GXZ93_03595 [Actinobacteria bacterium]|nr:hypothetical protein [Actinomycetota bacterium]